MWLHLPLPLVHLANEAVEVGFTLHHASQESQSVVLCAWLEEGPSRLPHYASHQVGVSGDHHMTSQSSDTPSQSPGVVFREDKGQVLVVQDKFKVHNVLTASDNCRVLPTVGEVEVPWWFS